MAPQTKQDQIDELRAQLKLMTTDARSMQAEIDMASGTNSRLAKDHVDARDKIDKLKDVARFYRAQRDRVDAYLSATIDAAERQNLDKFGGYPSEDRVVETSRAVEAAPTPSRMQRPRVQEPGDGLHQDGSMGAMYRDREPPEDWENF